MPIIAVANQKGGVGKTTTSVNLAVALRRLELDPVLVDVDPQASASSHLGVDISGRTSTELFTRSSTSEKLARQAECRIVPGNKRLAQLAIELASARRRQFRLREMIDSELAIIDCPPSLSLLTVNALVAADYVLVPVNPDFLSIEGLARLLDTIAKVEGLRGSEQEVGIVFTRVDRRQRITRESIRLVRRRFKGVFETEIGVDVKLKEAPVYGKSIFSHAPSSRGAWQHMDLAKEVVDRWL